MIDERYLDRAIERKIKETNRDHMREEEKTEKETEKCKIGEHYRRRAMERNVEAKNME